MLKIKYVLTHCHDGDMTVICHLVMAMYFSLNYYKWQLDLDDKIQEGEMVKALIIWTPNDGEKLY